MVTEDVSAAHTIYNKTGGIFQAGILIRVTQGDAVKEHLDFDTLVEVPIGGSVVVDPTAYSGTPEGVGVLFRSDAVDTTASEQMIRDGVVTTNKKGDIVIQKAKAKN